MMQGTIPNESMWVRRAMVLALWSLAVVVTACIGLLVRADPANATIFRVNSMEDGGDLDPGDGECATDFFLPGTEPNCTLRAAIQETNVNGESDTIVFDSALSGTITLTFGGIRIDNDVFVTDLDLLGPGARKITVSANDASNVFVIREDTGVTIDGLTISDGNAPIGGGILSSGTLKLNNSTVRDNTTTIGTAGGIDSNGTLELNNSTVRNNTGKFAGGIYSNGTLRLNNSTVSSNTATGSGGNSPGGGIYARSGTVALANSTVSGNTANGPGGGIYAPAPGQTAVTLENTIVARNTATTNPDVEGAFTSEGRNLIGDTIGATGFVASDLLNVNPLLGPLQNNGGPTDTRALLPDSPAIDAGRNDACTLEDQRGVVRKDGDRNGSVICDIGAFERNDLSPPKVGTTAPAGGAMEVRRSTSLTATFSEKMSPTSITNSTFKLHKVSSNGSTIQITNVTVALSSDGIRARLNPFGTSPTLLGANTNYRAVVTTGARDPAGNQLDQSPTASGKQQKVWTFKTGGT